MGNVKSGSQRVCEFSLTGPPEQVNALLAQGYEVSDIIPIHQTSGGAIYTRARGNYVLRVLILLSPSERMTRIECKLVTLNNGYLSQFNELLETQNNLGNQIIKILPLDVFLDPEAHAGIGKGTCGFAVFFIKEVENEMEDADGSGSRD